MWSKNGCYHPSLWTPFLRNWIPNPKFFSLTRGIKMQHILLVLIEYYVLNVRRNRYFLMLISNIGRSKFVYKISCMKILLWRGQNNSVHQTSLGMNKSDLIQCGSLCSDSLLYDQMEFVLNQILIKHQPLWVKEIEAICVNILHFGNLLVLIIICLKY